MKILFLGDSITEGIPGVPYIPMIQKSCKDCNLVNKGVGGDTVSSLFRRVIKMDDLSTYNHIVLFIGVNDVFGKLKKTYKILKTLRKQRWAKDISMFKNQYNDLIAFMMKENSNIIVIPPLIIGEHLNNKWNIEIKDLVNIISDISKHNNLTYLDIYSEFEEYLSNKETSDYLPIKVSEIYKDVKRLTNSSLVDLKSKKRKLHLTLDGVHVNSKGAKIISKAISNYLNSK